MARCRCWPWLAAAWLIGVSFCIASAGQVPKVGDKAPLIEGQDQDGKTWKLAEVLGKKVVLNTGIARLSDGGLLTQIVILIIILGLGGLQLRLR